jgi:hypothetical protein
MHHQLIKPIITDRTAIAVQVRMQQILQTIQ